MINVFSVTTVNILIYFQPFLVFSPLKAFTVDSSKLNKYQTRNPSYFDWDDKQCKRTREKLGTITA